MIYKLIIFDLDGVIVKSNSICRNVIDNFDKYDWVERLAMSFISFIGSIPCVGPVFKLCALFVIEACSGEYKPIKEVVDFIKYTPGYKMAILSSDTRQFIEKHLERLGILGKFDVIISGEDVRKLKPNPEGLRKVLEKTKVYPHEAIYLGSGYIDCMTGNNAQVTTVSSLNELNSLLKISTCFFICLEKAILQHLLIKFLKCLPNRQNLHLNQFMN